MRRSRYPRSTPILRHRSRALASPLPLRQVLLSHRLQHLKPIFGLSDKLPQRARSPHNGLDHPVTLVLSMLEEGAAGNSLLCCAPTGETYVCNGCYRLPLCCASRHQIRRADVDVPSLVEACTHQWYNQTLLEGNEIPVVRLGVMQGEYHWHKHDNDDEFFSCSAARSSSIWKAASSRFPRSKAS